MGICTYEIGYFPKMAKGFPIWKTQYYKQLNLTTYFIDHNQFRPVMGSICLGVCTSCNYIFIKLQRVFRYTDMLIVIMWQCQSCKRIMEEEKTPLSHKLCAFRCLEIESSAEVSNSIQILIQISRAVNPTYI